MNVLVMWPPHIPSYFNAGHHIPVFQVGAYLRNIPEVSKVVCVDAGALNYTWKEIGDLLVQNQFDIVAIMNDFDAIDTFGRLTKYIRTLSPNSKILTFGRLSKQIPNFFKRYDIDGIVYSGDYESGVESFVRYCAGKTDNPPGLIVKNGVWVKCAAGEFLPPEKWVLPDVMGIPYEAYDYMYRRDENKFCGIPQRRELVVNVARGCPVGCQFCDVPQMQGLRERRLPVDRVIEYIERSFEKLPFEYVSMYAPTFTLDRKWVFDFCHQLISRGSRYPWKCVTTLFHLDEELIKVMAESGCKRISVGLETLDPNAGDDLPKIKRNIESKFDQVADWCLKYGIELNCFVILGLPNETIEGAKYTIDRVRAKKARVRPTIYTPYHQLRDDMNEEEVASFNRQLIPEGIVNKEDEALIYQAIFGEEPSPTKVFEKIPKRQNSIIS